MASRYRDIAEWRWMVMNRAYTIPSSLLNFHCRSKMPCCAVPCRLRLLIIICLINTCIIYNNSFADDEIEKYGTAITVLIPVIAYGTTFYVDDAEGRSQFYKPFAVNLVLTYGLKNIIDKKRPNDLDQSFPSGHTSVAFQGAAFIHRRYGVNYAVPAYIGASFVGYSRVESRNHYIEDVIAGAAAGIISSFYFVQPHKGFMVTPSADNGTYGIKLGMYW